MGEPLPPGRHALTVPAGSSERLDLLVAQLGGLSRTQAATLIATGKVQVDGRVERASFRPEAGARIGVEIVPPPGREIVPEQIRCVWCTRTRTSSSWTSPRAWWCIRRRATGVARW